MVSLFIRMDQRYTVSPSAQHTCTLSLAVYHTTGGFSLYAISAGFALSENFSLNCS